MIAINLFVTWHLQEPMNSQDKADIRAINLLVAWHLKVAISSQGKANIIAINLLVTWHLQEPINSQDKTCNIAINLSVTWHLQEPINSQDKADVIRGQSYRGQHHQHGDEARTGDTGRAYTGTGRCQAVIQPRDGIKLSIYWPIYNQTMVYHYPFITNIHVQPHKGIILNHLYLPLPYTTTYRWYICYCR